MHSWLRSSFPVALGIGAKRCPRLGRFVRRSAYDSSPTPGSLHGYHPAAFERFEGTLVSILATPKNCKVVGSSDRRPDFQFNV